MKAVTRYRFDQIVVDATSRRLHAGGAEQQCSARVFDLLQMLCERPGTVFSRDELIRALWPERRLASDESLSQVLFKLRSVMGDSAHRLVTVRGVGIRLDADVVADSPRATAPDAIREPPPSTAGPARRIAAKSYRWASGLAAIALTLALAAYVTGERRDPLLTAYGLENAPAHMNGAAHKLLVDALRADARGDRQEAIVLLKSAHDADERTALPALLLTVWNATATNSGVASEWLDAVAKRPLGEPVERLYADLARALVGTNEGDAIGALGGLIQAHPDAWKLRLARARYRAAHGEDIAALADLDAIAVNDLDDPTSGQVLIKRAALGHLAQARAAYSALPRKNTASYLLVGAELAHIAGDHAKALADFRLAAEMAHRQSAADLTYRAEILAGVLASLEGLREEGIQHLNNASRVAEERHRPLEQMDALLLLSQVSADPAVRDLALMRARTQAAATGDPGWPKIVELVALRLGSAAIAIPETRPEDRDALDVLIDARRAYANGDADRSAALLRQAVNAGILATPAAPEALALAQPLRVSLAYGRDRSVPTTDTPFFPMLCTACAPDGDAAPDYGSKPSTKT